MRGEGQDKTPNQKATKGPNAPVLELYNASSRAVQRSGEGIHAVVFVRCTACARPPEVIHYS